MPIYFLPLSETHSSSSSPRQFPVLIARAFSQPDREIPPSCEFRFCFYPDVVIPLPLRSTGCQAFFRRAIAPGCYPRSTPPALVEHHNNRAGSARGARRLFPSTQSRNRAFHASICVPAPPGSGNGTASAGCSGSSWVGRLSACRSETHVPGQASGRVAQPVHASGSWLTRETGLFLEPLFFAPGRQRGGTDPGATGTLPPPETKHPP